MTDEKPPSNLVLLPGGGGSAKGDPEITAAFEEAIIKLRDLMGGDIRAFAMVIVAANDDVMAIHEDGHRWHSLVAGLDGVRFRLHMEANGVRDVDD